MLSFTWRCLDRDEYLKTISRLTEEKGLVIKYSGVEIAVFPSNTPHTCWQDFIYATNEVEDYDCEDMGNMRRLEDLIRKRLDWSLVSGEVDKHTQIQYVFMLFKVHSILTIFVIDYNLKIDNNWLYDYSGDIPSNQKSIYSQSYQQIKTSKRVIKKEEEEYCGFPGIEDDSDDEDWQEGDD